MTREGGHATAPERAGVPRAGAAFLLAQLGAFGAHRFAERLAPLGINPAHAGVLRLLTADPGMSQRQLADRLGAVQSRVVALVDDLEDRGLVTRERAQNDRRVHLLHLTAGGRRLMVSIRQVARAHDAELTAPLSSAEREQLAGALGRLAEAHGLAVGVHPGYRSDPPPDLRTQLPASHTDE